MDTKGPHLEWWTPGTSKSSPGTEGDRALLTDYVDAGVQDSVENVRALARGLRVQDELLAVMVHEVDSDSSYVCSPWNRYVAHAREQLQSAFSQHEILLPILDNMLANFGGWLRYGDLDRTVSLQNWLFPECVYPEGLGKSADRIQSLLLEEYPDHAILLRSLNETLHARLMVDLRHAGFQMLPNRPIWLLRETEAMQSDDVPEAGKALAHKDFQEDDYASIVDLHHTRDLRIPSRHHPKYGQCWIRTAHESRFVEFMGVRGDAGSLLAVAAIQRGHGVLTLPIAAAWDEGALQQLVAMVRRIALEEKLQICVGAGPKVFWEDRPDTEPIIEYLAVNAQHLPWERRIRWDALEFLLTRAGIPLTRRLSQ